MIEVPKDGTVFYGIRKVGTNELVEVGDYTDLDMGSFTTNDGVMLSSRFDGFDEGDLLELLGEDEELEIVEVLVSVRHAIKRVNDEEPTIDERRRAAGLGASCFDMPADDD